MLIYFEPHLELDNEVPSTESVINEQFGFLDRAKGRESFLDSFVKQMEENEYGKIQTSLSTGARGQLRRG